MKPFVSSIGVAFLVSLASVASAQTDTKAAAEVLFQDARKLMADKKFAEACPKFAESTRLDPGVGVMLYLADCFEKNGQTASAWAQFREVESIARRDSDARATVAAERAAALEPKLARVVVDVPPSSAVEGLEIRRDGAIVGTATWGTPVPVDPGRHVITASAPKRREWHAELPVEGGGDVVRFSVPVLEVDPVAMTPAGPVGTPSEPATGGDSRTGLGTQRTLGLVAGGVGVAAVGLGAYFGLVAISKNDDSKMPSRCDASNQCDDAGFTARKDAQDAALVSTVAIASGLVLIAGGVVLYLAAPRASTRAFVSPDRRGGSLTVRF